MRSEGKIREVVEYEQGLAPGRRGKGWKGSRRLGLLLQALGKLRAFGADDVHVVAGALLIALGAEVLSSSPDQVRPGEQRPPRAGSPAYLSLRCRRREASFQGSLVPEPRCGA